MDLSTVASAVSLLILTKAVERTGEMLGEKVVQTGNDLWKLLQQRKPETAGEIVKIATSDLSQSETLKSTQAIISDIQQLADKDTDFRQSVETAVQQWQIQSGGISNSSKIAENIGIHNIGLMIDPKITQNF